MFRRHFMLGAGAAAGSLLVGRTAFAQAPATVPAAPPPPPAESEASASAAASASPKKKKKKKSSDEEVVVTVVPAADVEAQLETKQSI